MLWISITIGGRSSAVACSSYLWRLDLRIRQGQDATAIFNQFARRFQSRQSYGQTFTVQFDVAGGGSFSFIVNDGVLLYEPTASDKADSVINMDLDTVRNIGAKKLSLGDALQLEQTSITRGQKYAEMFGSLIQ